jgi:hypothetical protein
VRRLSPSGSLKLRTCGKSSKNCGRESFLSWLPSSSSSPVLRCSRWTGRRPNGGQNCTTLLGEKVRVRSVRRQPSLTCILVAVSNRTRAGKWAFFVLPLITILREGIEAVVFVGGVSLGQPATSIPLATITGIICSVFIGCVIYAFAIRTSESFLPHSLVPRRSRLIPVNSVGYIHRHHDQLNPPHRCRAFQQVN